MTVPSTYDFTGGQLTLADDWEVRQEDSPTVLLTARADLDGRSATVVLTCDELEQGMLLREWQELAETSLAEAIPGYWLLDLQHLPEASGPGVHRLFHHVHSGAALTVEQYAVTRGTVGYTLTVTQQDGAWLAREGLAGAIFAGLELEERA